MPVGGLLGHFSPHLGRSWSLLNRSWPLQGGFQDAFHQKRCPKWDPKRSPAPHFLLFQIGVQNWTPHFMAFQEDFMAFQKQFQRFPRALSAANIITDGLQDLIFKLPVWNAVPQGLQISKRVGRRCQAAWPFGSAAPRPLAGPASCNQNTPRLTE